MSVKTIYVAKLIISSDNGFVKEANGSEIDPFILCAVNTQIPLILIDADYPGMRQVIDNFNIAFPFIHYTNFSRTKEHTIYSLHKLNTSANNFKDDTMCLHKWHLYEGVFERYEFCSICDEKKEVK